ncbi:MAG: hypothetical protein A2086_07405 [Spirochaetes bacterium GWD1_27_9]|nr:MAG: hypothetical protein A2Z98_13270 [Spirochaetes bacterium GWB1_27_13]OHD26280.1 MAG: hypothetical protein A2Y34_13195 [Spirochaetes bacterium GWC1_27_15]OHD32120.1 MAG: hypothetical protein A2086_07405 [Spirochaetes bacterium GWD1_27_9]
MIETIESNNIKWLNIINPTTEDAEYLSKQYKFHDLDIEDCLSKVQRSKIETYPDYKFIVLHFPIWYKKSLRLKIEELDILWGKDYIITLYSNKLTKLYDIFNLVKTNEHIQTSYFSKGADYLLYKIISELVHTVFPIMNQIGYEIDLIDSNIDTMKPSRIVEKISALRRNIIFLQTSIKPQKGIFLVLENQTRNAEVQDMDIYWGDVGDYIAKLIDTAEDFQELIQGLSSSIDTLLTFRTNNSIKTLTIFSVIMLPLNLITSFYGMNIKLPFADLKISSFLIMFIMLSISVSMIVYFKIKKI